MLKIYKNLKKKVKKFACKSGGLPALGEDSAVLCCEGVRPTLYSAFWARGDGGGGIRLNNFGENYF